jgi:hypothetical protein
MSTNFDLEFNDLLRYRLEEQLFIEMTEKRVNGKIFYYLLETILSYCSKNFSSITLEDRQDICSESITTFMEKFVEGKIHLEYNSIACAISYLKTMTLRNCLKRIKQLKRVDTMEDCITSEDNLETLEWFNGLTMLRFYTVLKDKYPSSLSENEHITYGEYISHLPKSSSEVADVLNVDKTGYQKKISYIKRKLISFITQEDLGYEDFFTI